MPEGKLIACCEYRIAASSSSSDNDKHELWGADQEEAPEAHALTHDTASSSAMQQRRRGVPS